MTTPVVRNRASKQGDILGVRLRSQEEQDVVGVTYMELYCDAVHVSNGKGQRKL